MGKEEERNIFDASKDHPGKKKPKTADRSPPPAETQKTASPTQNVSTEAKEMLQKMELMGDDLQKKMDEICELCGMTRKELNAYIENPQNFPAHSWEKAQTEKTKLEKKIYTILGIQQKQADLKKKRLQMDKERKGKTLGGRKGWIQM